MTSQKSTKFTLWCNRLIAAVVVLLCFTMNSLIQWYQEFRSLGMYASAAVQIGFYCCIPEVLYAQWCIDRLLTNILSNQVFVTFNVRCIRRIRWCCAGVSLVCLAAGFLYQPLLFLSVIMAFLALVVSVVKNVMAAAVEIREENDLTV